MTRKKQTSNWHDGIRAILVASLITISGTTITAVNNYYTNSYTQQRQAFSDSKAEALKIQKKMTNKMNDRYVYALRIIAAYNWQVDQEKRYTEYDDAVKRWNDELIINLSDIKRYFGGESQKEVFAIIKKFNSLHIRIMKMHNLYVANMCLPEIKPLLSEVYEMDDVISTFADKLQDQLQEGKVDIYSPKPPIHKPAGMEVNH